ncbi:MAG: hypothetical protein LBC79_07030 [Deltaproteobacteria bacterium]|jgi:hypothetical protein|nr:hypothetical protein [Deltaproteobacteria bacterium]
MRIFTGPICTRHAAALGTLFGYVDSGPGVPEMPDASVRFLQDSGGVLGDLWKKIKKTLRSKPDA